MTIILISVIFFALIFEFINGFHDTANAIATSVYTRALSVGAAIALAASMNFLGALVFEGVAKTISTGLVSESANLEEYVILAALLGAIIWNLFTWWRAIPSSSSHALIGSLVGASIVYTAGIEDIVWSGVLEKVIIPLFTSPIIGFLLGFGIMKLIFVVLASRPRARTNKVFSKLQIFSAAAVAFTHGTNDAQKTMGIITLALVTSGVLDAGAGIPLWVKLACGATIAAGTSVGGWKIMKTMGGGVTKLEPAGGFAAQTSSAIVIQVMTLLHAPISTTHVITTSVMGVGSARRLKAVKWKIAKDIVLTWVITLPVCAFLGAFCTIVIEGVIAI
ncbi:MAG: inorganic phosphate transporter [Coriobacteriales bacterium]|jgi:PiT family inorganic phosphate transporter|nr:inorganic phosphate transporter [Coriobacteriales bacterium]